MNPIDELRAARPAHLGERPVNERTRAAELAYAMSMPRQRRRRWLRAARPVWGLGLAGAVAAATAFAVVLSGTGTPPDGSPAVAIPETPHVTLSARDVLLAAAGRAERQAEGSGGYWHTVSVQRNLFVAKEGGYLVVDEGRSEGWTPRATGGDQWARSRRLGARPATEADRRAWERAGSPSEIEIAVPGKRGTTALPVSGGPATTSHTPLVDGDKVFWLGRNVTMKELRALPHDPGALRTWLMDAYEGHGTESAEEEMPGDVWLFKVAVGLIMDMPVTPEVRGAAFRMLAGLDGVRVTQDVTDAEGRRGTAVSVEERTRVAGVLENRLVFDERTGRALANEYVVVRPAETLPQVEPGALWSSTALIGASWTDDRPTG
ncbi:CU044_5270 family protein [Nonomuraea aridisoli]|uniref:CU044_5270 family protein n=1 Tax=Nonomuraea aridisoli TaxID=2070368 RepID=A0A2W2E2Z6_9ACTN|nr:CU044_5270 family protein [Nonomuraea aridisoli]PZG16963.1 hypothetical protein C1J01_19440 [Nonomuraea aridisoli]